MRRTSPTSIVAVMVAGLWGAPNARAADGFEGWDLEPGVAQAHLVMVARVSSVSRVTVVEGAKTTVSMQQFKFQPIKRLKGLFQRDELSMTASDLGITAEVATSGSPLKEGEFRLLVLTQQRGFGSFDGVPTFGCAMAAPGATTFDERVPLLAGPDDPLASVVETLIKVVDSRSRRERARLLLERLAAVDGVAAVPLLTSLQRRADWAASDERAYAPKKSVAGDGPAPSVLAMLTRSETPAVRGAAVKVLRDVLAAQVPPADPARLDGLAEALRAVIDSDEANAEVRLAAVKGLERLLNMKFDYGWAHELLARQVTGAATHAERAAAAAALSRLPTRDALAALLSAFANLPLDEPSDRETVYARAIIESAKAPGNATRSEGTGVEAALLERFRRSTAARQLLEGEIKALARLGSKESLPLLLAAATDLSLSAGDRQYLAWALGCVGDDRAVPVLVDWLRGGNNKTTGLALSALEQIDSDLAAREARPALKSESGLYYKLRLARLLARHGIPDGYALATEHLSDANATASAALVLAALDDPRTVKDLAPMLTAPSDRNWHAAALAGLAAIDHEEARRQLRGILADERNPLVVGGAIAAGLSEDAELLEPLATLAQSRNKSIAMASLRAMRSFLSGARTSPRGLAVLDPNDSGINDAELREINRELLGELQPAAEVSHEARSVIAGAAAALAADAYVDADVRSEALAVARLLGGERYAKLLMELADQAELEGSNLLTEVTYDRRRLAESAR